MPIHKPRTLAGIGLAVLAMACFAVLDTTTKWVSLSVPLVMALGLRYLIQAVVTTATVLPQRGLAVLHTQHLGLHVVRGLLLMGVMATVGHYLFILAFQRAPVATLMPYTYTQIAFALLGGWLLFSHIPDAWSLAGMALIALCGAAGAWLSAYEARATVAPKPPA